MLCEYRSIADRGSAVAEPLADDLATHARSKGVGSVGVP